MTTRVGNGHQFSQIWHVTDFGQLRESAATRARADTVAARLAAANPGAVLYVLESVAAVRQALGDLEPLEYGLLDHEKVEPRPWHLEIRGPVREQNYRLRAASQEQCEMAAGEALRSWHYPDPDLVGGVIHANGRFWELSLRDRVPYWVETEPSPLPPGSRWLWAS